MAKKALFDKNILIIIGFVAVLALSVFIFKWATSNKCPDIKFAPTTTEIKAGEPAIFADNTEGAKTWDWDFGDSTAHETARTPTHIYAKAGDYTIILKVNGCESAQKITVASAQIVEMDTVLPIGKIEGPDKAKVGEVVKFKDVSSIATTWEWAFGESGKTDATEKEPSYTFKSPGPHTVTLIINGKSNMAQHKIFIQPVPTAPVSQLKGSGGAHPKAPSLTDVDFAKMLTAIANRTAKGAEVFAPFMCNYTNMPITVNGKSKQFDSYCKGLYLGGVKSINSVKQTLDPGTGCITGVDITQTDKPNDD